MSGTTRVGIVGASGYSGIELTRILARHPNVSLALVASDRWAGDTVAARLGLQGSDGLRYVSQEATAEAVRQCEVVFLATPAEASLQLAPGLLAAGVRVIDSSGAFRLQDASQYPQWYKVTHPRPDLLGEAVYGLPELDRTGLAGARLVSNPGCYATAAALALAPLVRAGVLADEPLIIDAASGVTGAGRKASEDMSFAEVDEDFRAYRTLGHQHTPEIVQTLERAAGRPVGLTFTAHLLPIKRGILATCYAHLAPGLGTAAVHEALMHVYSSPNSTGDPTTDNRFVTVAASPDAVSLKQVVRTNRCIVAAAVGDSPGDPRRVVVVAALDNLVKGAAGQAVQNLNIVMGWDEAAGLDALTGGHP